MLSDFSRGTLSKIPMLNPSKQAEEQVHKSASQRYFRATVTGFNSGGAIIIRDGATDEEGPYFVLRDFYPPVGSEVIVAQVSDGYVIWGPVFREGPALPPLIGPSYQLAYSETPGPGPFMVDLTIGGNIYDAAPTVQLTLDPGVWLIYVDNTIAIPAVDEAFINQLAFDLYVRKGIALSTVYHASIASGLFFYDTTIVGYFVEIVTDPTTYKTGASVDAAGGHVGGWLFSRLSAVRLG